MEFLQMPDVRNVTNVIQIIRKIAIPEVIMETWQVPILGIIKILGINGVVIYKEVVGKCLSPGEIQVVIEMAMEL